MLLNSRIMHSGFVNFATQTTYNNEYSRHSYSIHTFIHIVFVIWLACITMNKKQCHNKTLKNISIKCNGFSSFGFYYFLLSYFLNLYLLLLVFSTMYVPSIWEKNTEGGRDKQIFALKLEFSAPKISMSDNLYFFHLKEGEFLSSTYWGR